MATEQQKWRGKHHEEKKRKRTKTAILIHTEQETSQGSHCLDILSSILVTVEASDPLGQTCA
jgi:P2-related tail formation protein